MAQELSTQRQDTTARLSQNNITTHALSTPHKKELDKQVHKRNALQCYSKHSSIGILHAGGRLGCRGQLERVRSHQFDRESKNTFPTS